MERRRRRKQKRLKQRAKDRVAPQSDKEKE